MARQQNAVRPVVGVYGSTDEAREAMVALERAGIGGGSITVVGHQSEEGAVPNISDADAELVEHMSTPLKRGALAGAVIGAAVGLALGLVLSMATGNALWGPRLWTPILAGVLPGVLVGALIAYRSNVAMTPDWSRTFTDLQPGSVCVMIQAGSSEEQESAVEALQGTNPNEVFVTDGTGQVCRRC